MRRALVVTALAAIVALAAVQALTGCSRRTAAPPGAPNLLFILADDLRWDCLGVVGHPALKTPNIDALANEGVLFTNHFVSTSICECSRASIFTGQYVSRHGIVDFDQPFKPAALAATYPLILRDHGYRVGFIGKWGVGGKKPDKEFDYFRAHPDDTSYWREAGGRRVHDTRLCVEEAAEFLKDGDDRPFCLSVSFKAPHGPTTQLEPEFEHLYGDVAVPVPPVSQADLELPQFLRDTRGGALGGRRTREQLESTVRGYYRLIAGLDAAVGDIRAALVKSGRADNTVVIFTSDNGLFLGEHALSGKWLMYDECIRVPLVVRDPALPASSRGRREERMTLNIDIAPTLLDYASVAAPASMQGVSLRPLLRGESPPTWRRDWFYEFHESKKLAGIVGVEGVRSDRWAYARYVDVTPPYEQLFDLTKDPREETNLAAAPEAAPALADMRARWEALRAAAR